MFRAGEIDAAEGAAVNNRLVASVGTFSVRGMASTMACIAEALGMTGPGCASPPATTADRIRVAEETGTLAVQMARERLNIDKVLTAKVFENAMRVLLAIGGSTNGIIHLTAIAGRMGFEVDLMALDRMGRETPVLLDLKPSGRHHMKDFHDAGGLATLLRELKPLLHWDSLTVTGRTPGEEMERYPAVTCCMSAPKPRSVGPLAHVRNGDRIRLSVPARALDLLVSDAKLARRRAIAPVVEPIAARGYRKPYLQPVLRAGQDLDFDFLRAATLHGSVPSFKT